MIDRDVDGLGKTAVGGDDISDFESDHITGYALSRFDLCPFAVAAGASLGG